MSILKIRNILAASSLFLLSHASLAQADVATFTVDPTQSRLRLEEKIGLYNGAYIIPMTEQSAGSLSTTFNGDITTDISGNSFRVLSASLLAANAGSYQPGQGCASPSSPANYGGFDNAGFPLIRSALRDIALTAQSAQTAYTVGNSFNASSFNFKTLAGHEEYAFDVCYSDNLVNLSANNKSTATGVITNSPTGQTLSFDADFTLVFANTTYRLYGRIVATRSLRLQADFDGDGDVDGADYLTWQRNYGKTSAVQSEGDANGDGIVDSGDFVLWKMQYGKSLPAAAPALAATSLQSRAVNKQNSRRQQIMEQGFAAKYGRQTLAPRR